MTITEFLLARIAEDEEDARRAQQGRWKLWGYDVLADTGENSNLDDATPVADVRPMREDRPDGSWFLLTWNARHIARWDPARVLAECEAKRRIINAHARLGDVYPPDDFTYQEAADSCVTCGYGDDWKSREYGNDWPCFTLKALAQPHADHPQYQQEWIS